MRVDKLTITNMRAIEAATLTFLPGFNLVVGVNGVGKTTLLDALSCALSFIVRDANALRTTTRDVTSMDIRFGSSGLSLECTVLLSGASHTYLVYEPRPEAATSRTGEGKPREETHEVSPRRGFLGPGPARGSPESTDGRPLAVLFATRRATAARSDSRKGRAVGGPGAAFSDALEPRDLGLGNMGDWMRAQEALRAERPESSRLLDALETATQRFLPGYFNLRPLQGQAAEASSAGATASSESVAFQTNIAKESRPIEPRPIRELIDVLGRPQRVAGPLDAAQTIAWLRSLTHDLDEWLAYPRDVQQALVGLVSSVGRHLQDEAAVEHDREAVVAVFRTLTKWSAVHRPGFVRGLSRKNQPTRETWVQDAEDWWWALAHRDASVLAQASQFATDAAAIPATSSFLVIDKGRRETMAVDDLPDAERALVRLVVQRADDRLGLEWTGEHLGADATPDALNKDREAARGSRIEAELARRLPTCRNLRPSNDGTPDAVVDRLPTTLLVTQLSDGERGMLAMVLDLTRRMAQANPHLADPAAEAEAVVLIDEIDLHLHPRWQRDVIHSLTATFPRCQFIATTHSPQVISEVARERVQILTPEGVESPGHSFGLDSSRVLEELMEVSPRPKVIQENIDRISGLAHPETLADARAALNELAARLELGEADPEVTRLRTMLDFLGDE